MANGTNCCCGRFKLNGALGATYEVRLARHEVAIGTKSEYLISHVAYGACAIDLQFRKQPMMTENASGQTQQWQKSACSLLSSGHTRQLPFVTRAFFPCRSYFIMIQHM